MVGLRTRWARGGGVCYLGGKLRSKNKALIVNELILVFEKGGEERFSRLVNGKKTEWLACSLHFFTNFATPNSS
jgi:hypothetical protein